MNNRNKILVGCLALLLVLSVGYALFSETIEINGTATAKGDFDIGFVCTSTTPTGAATGDCSISGQTITTKSNLTKPSENVTYVITLTNNGSIPAKLKTVTSPNNWIGDGTETSSTNAIAYLVKDYFLYAMYEVEGVDMADETYDTTVMNANIVLQPNESKVITVTHAWADYGDEQPALPEAGVTMNYNVSFGFEQVAAN